MVWKPTATTLTCPPVSCSQSGARRWSGSATCGPLNVRMLTLMPLNLSPCEAAGLGAVDAAAAEAEAPVEAAADAVAAGGADAGAPGPAGDGVVDAALHPASTSTKPIAGATVLNRDTGFLLLTLAPASSILNARR